MVLCWLQDKWSLNEILKILADQTKTVCLHLCNASVCWRIPWHVESCFVRMIYSFKYFVHIVLKELYLYWREEGRYLILVIYFMCFYFLCCCTYDLSLVFCFFWTLFWIHYFTGDRREMLGSSGQLSIYIKKMEIKRYWVLVVGLQYINFIGNKKVLGSNGQPSI